MLSAIRGQIEEHSFAMYPLIATFLKGTLWTRLPVNSQVPLHALDFSSQFLAIYRRLLSLRTNISFLPKIPKPDYINREIYLEALPIQGQDRVPKCLHTLCPVRAL